MIRSIHISNYALISNIDIDFTDGLNIITGETGAGKSIMLGALTMLLGGRADAKVITDASKKSVVEAYFVLDDPEDFAPFFARNDLDMDGSIVILRREIAPNGRSRAFINDSPVNLSVLRELAIHLVDIHSQHQNLLLADTAYQLQIIDTLAGNEGLLNEYHKAYNSYQVVLKRYSETRDMLRRGSDEADFLSYQLDELNDLDIRPGEQAALEREREALSDVSDVKAMIANALAPMSGDVCAIDTLEDSVDAIHELSDAFADADALADRLDAALVEIRDIADTLERYNEDCAADPERLEMVEQRLSKLYSLEVKHHVDDSDSLIALRDKLAAQLQMIENGDELLVGLEVEARSAKKNAMILARRISEARHRCAEVFAGELREAALPLGMKNLRCEIALTTGRLSPSGIDQVDFMFAFNKNQPLMPVGQTASGGEISRLMLAVKAIVGQKMRLPSIIFDEIDTGVSGDVASRMGELMQSIAKRIQVITITHLPQVAAKGKSHFKVYKQDDEHSTTTRIRALNHDERVAELALMLSGSAQNNAAIEAAKSLLLNKL